MESGEGAVEAIDPAIDVSRAIKEPKPTRPSSAVGLAVLFAGCADLFSVHSVVSALLFQGSLSVFEIVAPADLSATEFAAGIAPIRGTVSSVVFAQRLPLVEALADFILQGTQRLASAFLRLSIARSLPLRIAWATLSGL
jgi:hypothetical protein